MSSNEIVAALEALLDKLEMATAESLEDCRGSGAESPEEVWACLRRRGLITRAEENTLILATKGDMSLDVAEYYLMRSCEKKKVPE